MPEHPGRLILLCGLPGSGKSTLARQLGADLDAIAISPDQWLTELELDIRDEALRSRLVHQLLALAWDLLRLGQTVVLDFGFWGRAERDARRHAARALGVPVELRFLEADSDELWRRLQGRNERAEPGTVAIRRVDLDEYATIFQAPDTAELALFDGPRS